MTAERVVSGLNQLYYPIDLIARRLPGTRLHEIAIAPDSVAPETLLFFPALEFVRLSDSARFDAGRIKCVALDLDHTLWRGTLLEDGAESLSLDPRVVEQVKLLRQVGIVTSIASRNDPFQAGEVLRRLGVDDLFVFPQIGWRPKSESLRRLADSLRIGLESIALVDDSPFERAEIRASLPEAQALEPSELEWLCRHIASGEPPTSAARERVAFYRHEEARHASEVAATGTHVDFLRTLDATVDIARVRASDMPRVHELIQRTNRLNFSNHRYSRAEVDEIVGARQRFRCSTISASDRFGDYGLIGFSIVDVSDASCWWVRDLMFSCRILGRHVDVFVLTRILEDARRHGIRRVTVSFNPSGRNEAARDALLSAAFVLAADGSFECDLAKTEIPRIDYIRLC
jgi:FkbH-like protein